jgi:hypothetical protein
MLATHRFCLTAVLAVPLCLFAASCGNEGKAADANVNFLSAKPSNNTQFIAGILLNPTMFRIRATPSICSGKALG